MRSSEAAGEDAVHTARIRREVMAGRNGFFLADRFSTGYARLTHRISTDCTRGWCEALLHEAQASTLVTSSAEFSDTTRSCWATSRSRTSCPAPSRPMAPPRALTRCRPARCRPPMCGGGPTTPRTRRGTCCWTWRATCGSGSSGGSAAGPSSGAATWSSRRSITTGALNLEASHKAHAISVVDSGRAPPTTLPIE